MMITSHFRWQRIVALLLVFFAATAQAQGFTPAQLEGTQRSAGSALDSIKGWLGADTQPTLLEPDQAFQIQARAGDSNTLLATLTPAPQYYLYRDRISFAVVQPRTLAIANVTLPAGKPKADPTFGTVQVFHRPVEAVIALKHPGSGSAREIHVRASYQGCNEPLGVCYPPTEKTVVVALPADASAVGTDRSPSAAAPLQEPGALDDLQILELFTSGSTWAIVAAFFGFGLLLAFAPCMLPMIPILTGIIVGAGRHASRRELLVLSAVYELGMALTYAAAGVAAGLAGTLLSAYLQNPWVLGAFAAIFVLLSLSMFGLYELQLPTALQSRLASAGTGLRGGRVAGVFGMGVLSAVIVGPCVAAPLAGALLYIGQTQDVVLGGMALFAMAVGMGVPLLVVGATAGTLLPRAGPWTEGVKRVFGVAMLALAIYTISPVVPASVQHLLWASLLVISAMYLHAIDPLPSDAAGHRRLFKGVGVLALGLGLALLVGAMSGNRDLLQPLRGVRSAGPVTRGEELNFQQVNSLSELQHQLEEARGRPVMLDFWADWCVSCLEMDRFTFSNPRVQAQLKEVRLLRADVTANTLEHRALLRRFSLFGPPGIVFFDALGKQVPVRVIGFQEAEQFLRNLERVKREPNDAFATLDATKVHFAVFGDWADDIHLLVRREEDRAFLMRLFNARPSTRFTFIP